jgi:hypothetical protein
MKYQNFRAVQNPLPPVIIQTEGRIMETEAPTGRTNDVQQKSNPAGRAFALVALGLIFIAVLIGISVANDGNKTSPKISSYGAVASTTETEPVKPDPSPWDVDASTNEVTGQKTIVAITGYGEQRLYIRQRGKRLEFYFTTGEFLETVENMHTNLVPVVYKFDDASVVRQSWTMSSDHEALFYPGNPSAFLNKMRKAKRFAIEFKPADKIEQAASFNVSQFPSEFTDSLRAVRSTRPAPGDETTPGSAEAVPNE